MDSITTAVQKHLRDKGFLKFSLDFTKFYITENYTESDVNYFVIPLSNFNDSILKLDTFKDFLQLIQFIPIFK